MLEGEGAVIGPVTYRGKKDGSSTIQFLSARRIQPDPDQATYCSCTYAHVNGESSVAIMTYYAVATAPNSTHVPMFATCEPHRKKCPLDNDTAFAEIGAPFIEEYAGCASRSVWRQLHIEMLVFVYLLAAGGLLIIIMLVSSKCGGPSLSNVSVPGQFGADDISQQICVQATREWDSYCKGLQTQSTMSPSCSARSLLSLNDAWTPEPRPSNGTSSRHLILQSHWSHSQMSADWLRRPLLPC